VWWSESELFGRRPVLVISRDAVAGRLARPLVARVTRRVRDLPTEVALDETDGMPAPCVVNLDDIAGLPASSLVSHITRLRADRMAAVCAALRFATECD
jgi:mRNA interferase MazF